MAKKNEQAEMPLTGETEAKQGLSVAEVEAMIAKMLADAKAENDRMLTEAKAEADRIVAEARKGAGVQSKERAAQIAADKEKGEELVEIRLYKGTSGKLKEPVFVAVNGENCVIERGVRLKVKRKFAEVLDHSEMQDYEVSQLIEAKKGKSEKLADL